MQMPFGPNPIADVRSDVGGHAVFSYAGQVLSIESQLKLRELFEYVEFSREILREVGDDLCLLESNPENATVGRKASARLEKFCLEADSWGFSALYHVGMGLQVLLVDSTGRMYDDIFWNTVNRGLAMLSALLDQCESDFRWRLATAEMLDSLEKLSYK